MLPLHGPVARCRHGARPGISPTANLQYCPGQCFPRDPEQLRPCARISAAPSVTSGARAVRRSPSEVQAQAGSTVVFASATDAAPPQQDEQQQPSPERKVEVEGIDILPVADGITLLRGVCNERLKHDIEFSRKRGTTDNCYVVKSGEGFVLTDVIDEVFTDQFLPALERAEAPLSSIETLVVTHLTPRRVPSLRAFLKARCTDNAPRLEVYLSNPALQALRSNLGKEEGDSELLSRVDLKAAKSGGSLDVGRRGRPFCNNIRDC